MSPAARASASASAGRRSASLSRPRASRSTAAGWVLSVSSVPRSARSPAASVQPALLDQRVAEDRRRHLAVEERRRQVGRLQDGAGVGLGAGEVSAPQQQPGPVREARREQHGIAAPAALGDAGIERHLCLVVGVGPEQRDRGLREPRQVGRSRARSSARRRAPAARARSPRSRARSGAARPASPRRASRVMPPDRPRRAASRPTEPSSPAPWRRPACPPRARSPRAVRRPVQSGPRGTPRRYRPPRRPRRSAPHGPADGRARARPAGARHRRRPS